MPITLEIPQYPDPSGPIAPTAPELPSNPVVEPSSPEPVGPVIDDPAPSDVPQPDDSPQIASSSWSPAWLSWPSGVVSGNPA